MPYTRILANGTEQISTTYTKLNKIIIGKKGASANTMTVWNGSPLNGQLVVILDSVNTAGSGAVIDFGGSNGGLDLQNGLAIVTATGTAPDALVIWNE